MINPRSFTTALAVLAVLGGAALAAPASAPTPASAPSSAPSSASAGPWQAPPGLYELDPDNVSMTISANLRYSAKWRFAMSRIRAQFHSVDGVLQVGEDGVVENTLVVEIVAADMEANGPVVEGILKGENFLNVEAHPSLDFVAAGFTISDAPQDLTGELTMAGRMSPVVFEARLIDHSTEEGRVRMRFAVEGAIARSDWGMTANRGFVSETIQVRIEAEFVRVDDVANLTEIAVD